MFTITIPATDYARDYVKELYSNRKAIIDTAERILDLCKDSLDVPYFASLNLRTRDAYSTAWDELEAIADALSAVGYMAYNAVGDIVADRDSVSLDSIRATINAYEGWNYSRTCTPVFRAVLSAFGVTYVYRDKADTSICFTYDSSREH